MPANSRSAILGRLRRLSRTGSPAPEDEGQAPVAPTPADTEQLVEMFTDAWAKQGGTWEEHENQTAARLALLLYLRELGVEQIMTWSTEHLPVPGLREAIIEMGISFVAPSRRDLDPEVVMGLTGVDAALADTASLVLVLASGQSWLPALFPIRHVTLLPISRLHYDLDTWRQEWETAGRHDELAHSLIVTGPSVSRDIELHAHYGMFGPRLMHLFLIDDRNPE